MEQKMLKKALRFSPGLSKGNARVEIFFVQSQIAVKSLTRTRDVMLLTKRSAACGDENDSLIFI